MMLDEGRRVESMVWPCAVSDVELDLDLDEGQRAVLGLPI